MQDEPSGAAGPTPGDKAESGRICVVMNSGSGKRRVRGQTAALEDAFAPYGDKFELRLVKNGSLIKDMARQACDEGFKTIVAAGGDGTICAVASVVIGTGRRMGVLPLGTFNYFARSLGIPDDTAQAVDVLLAGRVREIRVGDVNGRLFLNNASLGAYPAILERREAIYARWGRSRLAAYWSVLSTLIRFRNPLTMQLLVDGKPRDYRTILAFIANNGYQLDQLGMEGSDCVERGAFALFVARSEGRGEIVRSAIRLARGKAEAGEDFDLLCGQEIVIKTRSRRRLVALDGERERMVSPFRFTRPATGLQVVVPA